MIAMVDGSFLAAYRRASGSSPWAWFKGRRPSSAVLHSSREPGVRRPCSDFVDVLRCLINCRIIIIIFLFYLFIYYYFFTLGTYNSEGVQNLNEK